VLDTRTNPAFPRNAVVASAGWRVFDPEQGPPVNRYHVNAQGYLGLIGSTVLVVGAVTETADQPLPPYEKGLIGGVPTLRGFRAGSFVGDNIAAGSIELRMPYHSPMHMGQSGFTVFADAATAYDHGTRLSDAAFHCGVGAGWYLRVPLVSLNLDVAYGFDSGTRAHVTAGLRF
jgi:hemolysin activation/secretion protein